MYALRSKSVYWCAAGGGGKRRRVRGPDPEAGPKGDESEDGDGGISLPFAFPKMNPQATIYSHNNEIYFNDDITPESSFALIRELRQTEMRLKIIATSIGLDAPQRILLHLTTNGGCVHSALSIIDTIEALKVPVDTVIEGMVASAGTLVSLAGERRYIMKNAFALLHEVRSGFWGKMTSINEEIMNLKKVTSVITEYYIARTKITRKSIDKILKKDLIWDAGECIRHGVADEIYNP
jgi:ATP-dependent protease ClpP protease subunit